MTNSYYTSLYNDVLEDVTRHINSEKQPWNTWYEGILEPDASGVIEIDDDVIEVHPGQTYNGEYSYIIKLLDDGRRVLYDTKRRSYNFLGYGKIPCHLVYLLPYDEMPPVVKRYVDIVAVRRYNGFIFDNTEAQKYYSELEEAQAKATMDEYFTKARYYFMGKTRRKPKKGTNYNPQFLKQFYDDSKTTFYFNMMANEYLVLDSAVSSTIISEANGYFTGNYMKWPGLLIGGKIANGYDFTKADIAWNFGQNNNKLSKMHTLIWQRDDKVPSDLAVTSIPARTAQIHAHFSSMLTRYPDPDIVDVWNEITDPTINDPGDLTGDPEDYIANNPLVPAFTVQEIADGYAYARTFAPSSTFTYNDFKLVGTTKGTAAFAVVNALNAAGATVDAIAEQAHLQHDDYLPSITEWNAAATACRNNNLKLVISEFDISVEGLADTATKEQFQYDYVYNVFAKFLWDNQDVVHSVSFWGNLDPYTWLLERNVTTYPAEQPLPFGPDGVKKPFYDAFMQYFTEQINA